MKSKLISYVVVAIASIVVFRFCTTPRPSTTEQRQQDQAFLQSLESPKDQNTVVPKVSNSKEVILIKVQKEPKVLDAFINDAKVLYVSVRDDGTRRDGYAEYLCQLVGGSVVKRVKVVKVNSQNDPERDNAYGVLLGESWCK